LIDIGANLTSPEFRRDLEAVLERAVEAGVRGVMVTGTDLATSSAAARLAARYPDYLAATVGVHPHDAKGVEPGWLDTLEALLDQPCVKAVGETGLDFNRNYSPREAQLAAFDAQIELAVRLARPLFVHDRDSGGTVLERLRVHGPDPRRVVIHCFTGSALELEAYLDAGFMIGITGWICDERRGLELRKLVRLIPAQQLMIETDAPFLLPRTIEPKPPTRRNEPANLIWVARCIAEARGQSVDELIAVTSDNARRFFDLSPDRS
jgi:TatD DNase family protein